MDSNKTILTPSSHPLGFLSLLFSVVPAENEGEAPAGVCPAVPSPAMQEQHTRLPFENPQRSHCSHPLLLPGSALCTEPCVQHAPPVWLRKSVLGGQCDVLTAGSGFWTRWFCFQSWALLRPWPDCCLWSG